MTAEPRVLLGASPLGWVTGLTQWVSDHGGARLVGQALTTADIDPATFDLLVLDGWSSLLAKRLVDEVQREGAAVLVLVNADRPDAETARLRDLGVSLSLPVTAAPEEILARAREVAATRRAGGLRPPPPPLRVVPAPTGRLVTVLGDGGATELAVNLSAALARSGRSTVLVDLDTVDPSVAQRLGLALVPNVLTAVELVRAGRFDPAGMPRLPGGPAVIPGLANPREWDELGPVDGDELTRGLAARFEVTVAVVHPMLEDLAPLSGLEGRFDLARRTVERAAEVVVLAGGSPTGLVRALMLIGDVRALTQAPVHVVVNRIPASAFQRAEWREELERTFVPASLTFLPFDPRVEAAAWNGTLVERGRYHKEVRRLVAGLNGRWAA